ncbi:retrovirus-related pol polyprotein from transposon TNT 1-94 [Tanacetum coccineum]
MGIPNEHQLKFNSIKDAKSLWQAIKKRFGGNAATKKTQRNLRKQQYENFTTSSSEVLDQTFDRLQKLISQLEIHGESISQEDVNQKFLRSLSPEWNTHTIVWRNKTKIDILSLDDLYNNLKIYEPKMAMLTMRARRFLKNTGRNLTVNGNETIGFDKSKSDQAEEGPTNFALMAYSSISSISKEYLRFQDYIKVLKREIHLREVAITELRRKLELAQKQKDEIQLTVENFENSSKNLSKLIDCQIVDKCKTEEFTSEPIVIKPVAENSEAKASEEKHSQHVRPKAVVNAAKPKAVVNAARPKAVVNAENIPIYRARRDRVGYVAFGLPKEGKSQAEDESSGILKSFITGIENLIDQRVKVISVARTPQQNGVAKRENRTLIKAARTMLADSKLPTTFWAKAVNIACYVQNKDHLGKFDGKADEGFFVGLLDPTILLNLTKSSLDAGFKPSGDDEKKVTEEQGKEGGDPSKKEECNDQEKEDNVNNTNNVNAASTNEVNVVDVKTSIELPLDPNMPELEDYSIIEDDENVGAEDDMNNLDTTIQVSPILTIRIYKDHPLDQVIRDFQSAPQIRRMSKHFEAHGFVSTIQQRTNHKDLQNCCLSQEEPKKVIHTLKDPSWKEAMQEELLQFKLQEVLIFSMGRLKKRCPDFPDRVYKVEKALYGLHQAPRAWYETLSTYLLDNEFQRRKFDKTLFIKRYKDVKSASTPIETQKPLLKDEDGEEVDVHMYRSMIGSLMYLTSSRLDIMFAVCACARYQVNPKVSHLYVVKRFLDEVVNEEMDDSLVRAATTASSLEAEQVGRSARMVSSDDASLGDQEDASKQGRKIDDIDKDAEITLIDETQGSTVDPVTTAGEVVTTASPTETTTVDDLTVAQTLIEIRSAKFKVKGVVIGEQKEQEKLSIEEKSKLFVQLLKARKKHFVEIRAKEKRNKPPTKALKRNTMSTYLKNMAGYKHNHLKYKDLMNIKKLFDKAMKSVNTFVDMDTELVEGDEVRAEGSEKRPEGSFKRAGEELE